MEKSAGASTSGRPSGTGDTTVPAGSPSGSQPSSGRVQPRTVLSDRYHLGEELGRGAFGLVFKGVDTRTGGAVAIKQLSLAGISAETLQSIMGEIDLLRNLNHKNIVKYIGSFKTRTHLYIILEYMDRGAISSVIQPSQFGAFPESLVAVYIAQVLQGLAYLHDQGVVHRDIKGANILTTSEGLVKLADFGVAARLTELEADRDKKHISVVGTPYWMAPEVIEMTSTTPASDIWSVACLAVELLTGQPPYFNLLPMAALFRIVQDEKPELPSKMSADMHDFLHSCFQKDPQRRPTARELLRHRWITYNRRTLRSSWSRTQGAKAMGGQRDAHKSVSKVVEQILQAEADEFAASAAAATAGKPLPSQPEASSRGGAGVQIPMNQSRGTLTESSRGNSLDALAQELHAANKQESTLPSEPTDGGAQPAAATLNAAEGLGNGTEFHPQTLDPGGADSLATPPLGPGGLLDGMLRTEGAGVREQGENLLLWLELKEQNQVGGAAPPEQGGLPPSEDILNGGINKHQEAAEVKRLIALWRTGYGRSRGGQSPGRGDGVEREAIEAGQALMRMWREDVGHMETFLAEEGGVVLVELLQNPNSEKVAIHALQALNQLVAPDLKALGAAALLGAVPAVAKYAGPGGSKSLDKRLQAAYFLQYLATTNLLTAQLLVTCQGLPVLVRLIEPDFEEYGPLVHIGVNTIWRLLELHGTSAMNRICRLLAAHGLAHNLVHALRSAIAFTNDPKKQARGKTGRANGVSRQGSEADSQRLERSTTQTQAALRSPKEAHEAGSSIKAVEGKARLYQNPGSYDSLDSTEGLHALLDKMANLLLLLSHADTAVKATLCEKDTLKTLFGAIEYCPAQLQHTALKAVKQLTSDPSMLEALQDAGTIESLGRYLKASWSLPIQVEALHALHNLCKISRARQEGAANAGLVPYLMNLAQMSPEHAEADPLQEQLRQMAISLLCGMVHSTWNTRMALWNCNGLTTLLELLKEEDWQGPALDALAAWLVEDMNRIEGRLSQSVAKFVQLFNTYRTRGGSDALARLLDPFLRILRRSPQITIEVALAGLAGIVVEMLKTASALTALSLLQMVKIIYEHHPRPKEFVSKYAITDQLRELSRQNGPNSSVLVNKQATHLLHAFQINSIF